MLRKAIRRVCVCFKSANVTVTDWYSPVISGARIRCLPIEYIDGGGFVSSAISGVTYRGVSQAGYGDRLRRVGKAFRDGAVCRLYAKALCAAGGNACGVVSAKRNACDAGNLQPYIVCILVIGKAADLH